MDRATDMIGFAPDALWVSLGVLIGLGIIAKLVMDLVIKWRELRKPKAEDRKTINEKLAEDNKRLKFLEEKTAEQDKELKLILRGQIDILHHLADGNGIEKMKKTQEAIENYLITGEIEENGGK